MITAKDTDSAVPDLQMWSSQEEEEEEIFAC
jgi:hypothetical protein